MNETDYKYDVAFSFLQQDENIAIKLSDLLTGRFITFIYSEKQAELAGKDGEQTFNMVFGKEARIVVVLYRNDWGTTKWTRIEMTAIRNRAFENGYDFTLFIPLEDNSNLPIWLPKTQIWFNYNRWGVESAASIIEYKIQQEGGTEKKETVLDKATRLNREIEAQKKKELFINSVEGVNAAKNEIPILFNRIEELVNSIGDKTDHIKFGINKDHGGKAISILFDKYDLHIEWYGRAINTLRDSYLYYGLWQRPSMGERNQTKIFEYKFLFDVSYANNYGWKSVDDNKFYLSDQLAEICVNTLLDRK